MFETQKDKFSFEAPLKRPYHGLEKDHTPVVSLSVRWEIMESASYITIDVGL